MPSSSSATAKVTLSVSATLDCNTGLTLNDTDANGNIEYFTYDPMLRLASFTDRSGYQTTTTYTQSSEEQINPVFVTSTASFGSSIQSTTTMLDWAGRPGLVQTQQAPSSSNYDTAWILRTFNGTNPQVTVSSPCTAALEATCTTNETTALFDVLGRPVLVGDPLGGTLNYSYDANDASITLGPKPSGENSTKTAQTEVDGFGRQQSVCVLQTSGGTACGQVDGNSGILTSFTYAFGNGQSSVTSTRGSQSHTAYSDALGRTTEIQTPEAGTVMYYYDSNSAPTCGTQNTQGLLLEVLRNSGQYYCYQYDLLGRVLASGNNNNATTPCLRFSYDNTSGFHGQGAPTGYVGNNLMGQLVEAETDNCANYPNVTSLTDEWFSYDKNGRMTDMWESTPNSPGYYHTTVTYNPNGTVASLSGLPNYTAYTFGVDGEGRPSTMSQGSATIINGVTYDAASRTTQILIGNKGDFDSYTYDANEHMTNYTFSVKGTTDSGTPTWNADGTLKSLAIVDGFNAGGSQTCNFTHDDTNRLITDNCGSIWNQTFSYDQFDNLTKAGNPGTNWAPGYSQSNNTVTGFNYDGDGDVIYDFNNTYNWNIFGKMGSVIAGTTAANCGSTGNCFTYDAFGRMVERTNNFGVSDFLYSPIGMVALVSTGGNVVLAHILTPGGGAIWASSSGGATRNYDHMDWLGSARLETTIIDRGMTFDAAYTPYGELYNSFGTGYQTFTGDMQNDFAGLFDTPNRELDQLAGSRWLSPDPAHASWNAYAYVTNPNSQVDPSGLGEGVDDCGGFNVCSFEGDPSGDGPDGGCNPSTDPTQCGQTIENNTLIFNGLPQFGPTQGDGTETGTETVPQVQDLSGYGEVMLAGGFWGPNGVRGSDAAWALVNGTFSAPNAALAHHTCGDGLLCNVAVGFVTGVAIGGAQGLLSSGSAIESLALNTNVIDAAPQAVSVSTFDSTKFELSEWFKDNYMVVGKEEKGDGTFKIVQYTTKILTKQMYNEGWLKARMTPGFTGGNVGNGGDINPAVLELFEQGKDPNWLAYALSKLK